MSKSSQHPKSDISLPKRGTKAAADFFASWEEIHRFYTFVLLLVGRSDHVVGIAHRTLLQIEKDKETKECMIADHAKRRKATDALKDNRQFFTEVIVARYVENFLGYLSSLLFETFVQRPETLRSSDKIEVAAALKHESINSLVKELAERKVESLSYSSFADLKDFFEDRFHLSIATDAEVAEISKYIEIRNISVHNRCIINQRFLKRLGLDDSLLGQKRDLYAEDIDRIRILFATVVKKLDRIAAMKLHLKGINFKAKRS